MKNVIFVSLLCASAFVLLCAALMATLLQNNIEGIAAVAVFFYSTSTIAGWGITALVGLIGWDLWKAASPSRRAAFRESWIDESPLTEEKLNLLADELREAREDTSEEFARVYDEIQALRQPDVETDAEKELLDEIERKQARGSASEGGAM